MSKLLIFDFDGTLVDTGPGIVYAVNEFMTSEGRPALSEKKIISFVGKGLYELLVSVAPEITQSKEELKRVEVKFLQIYKRHLLSDLTPMNDIEEFLKNCPHKMAIVSNKRQQFIPPVLDHLGWSQFPWIDVVGGDTFSEKKPHPMPLLKVIEKAQVSLENTYMIGDGFPDVEAAIATGVNSVAVNFGYAPIEQLIAAGAQHSISNFADLYKIIY